MFDIPAIADISFSGLNDGEWFFGETHLPQLEQPAWLGAVVARLSLELAQPLTTVKINANAANSLNQRISIRADIFDSISSGFRDRNLFASEQTCDGTVKNVRSQGRLRRPTNDASGHHGDYDWLTTPMLNESGNDRTGR